MGPCGRSPAEDVRSPLEALPGLRPLLAGLNGGRRRALGRWRARGLRVEDRRYGPDPAQRVRIFTPPGPPPPTGWPALLLLHGGGWREGDLAEFAPLAPRLARQGLLAVAANYRLAPRHRWPAMLEDVEDAWDSLAALPVDPGRRLLWGFSAGGHLALMLAGRRPAEVRALVAMGAPTALDAPGLSDELELVFSPDLLRAASPLHLLGARPPPTLLVHGEADAVVPIAQARALRDRFPAEVRLIELPEGDHGLRWPPRAARAAREEALAFTLRQAGLRS